MISLPALHPIVLKQISSPPFEYSPQGLTFKGQPRVAIAEMKQGLFPKRKNAVPLNKNKDWWLAQLRLYGVTVKSSMKKDELMAALKGALSRGLDGPSKELLQLEQELARTFLLENAEAREKEYATLSEEKRAENHSERYLREKFFSGKNDEKLLALNIQTLGGVLNVAKQLSLHCESAYDGHRKWTVIGKNKRDVLKRKAVIDKEGFDLQMVRQMQESKERASKRRKVETHRQECEVGGEGSFKDVLGEWSIECPEMDQQYRKAQRSMSIFFHKPSTRRRTYDEVGCPYSDSEDDDDDDEGEEDNDTLEVNVSPLLCANFKMGILKGILRSKANLPAQSACFPVLKVPFTWRGKETGEGEIQLDYEGDVNVGSFSFISKAQVKGVFKSSLGQWSFSGRKVNKAPADTKDKWEDYSEEAYECERVGRWG